jgi:hypothetical protein
MRCHRRILLCLSLAVPGLCLAAPEISSVEAGHALTAAVGDWVRFEHLPLGATRDGAVRMQRIDIYAPDARLLVPEGDSYREVPRSQWIHFIADHSDPAAPRLGISMAPDGSSAQGILLADDGGSYALSASRFGSGLQFALRNAEVDEHGAPTDFVCQNDRPGWQSLSPVALQELAVESKSLPVITAASRTGVVAVDTDNEFMLQKFADNTTNASNYLAALFVGMNVIYERDLDLTLLQGTTFLRVSGTPDPYAETGANTLDQLDEFGEVWSANQTAVTRAFAMQLSGKSSSSNSSAGIAWVLGNVNYCTQKGSTFNSSSCSDQQCTAGHYSVSQVFKFAGATAANDLLVVSHELGHNFGANHTHCSDATTGAGAQSTNTIDQCYNSEGGCFSGAKVCPAASTVNGVANVKGTLMSYCHLSGISGCTSSPVFATAHRTLLTPRIASNVTATCFAPSVVINQAPTLNSIANPAAILEDAALQSVNLSGIGDGNGGTQTLSISAGSSNPGLIPTPGVTYTSPNSTGSISYTPVANQSGSAVITVTVMDNGGTAGGGVNSFARTFTVNVTAVNDPPTLNAIANPASIPVGAGLQTVNLSGISAGLGDPAQVLSISAVSNNTALIPNPSVIYTSPNSTGSISYTPLPGQQGSATITVTVTDNGGTANGGVNTVTRNFTQTVTANAVFANGFE